MTLLALSLVVVVALGTLFDAVVGHQVTSSFTGSAHNIGWVVTRQTLTRTLEALLSFFAESIWTFIVAIALLENQTIRTGFASDAVHFKTSSHERAISLLAFPIFNRISLSAAKTYLFETEYTIFWALNTFCLLQPEAYSTLSNTCFIFLKVVVPALLTYCLVRTDLAVEHTWLALPIVECSFWACPCYCQTGSGLDLQSEATVTRCA